METIVSKENIPTAGMEDQVVPVGKLGAPTPRQPLIDVKQVRQVQSVNSQGHKHVARVTNPLCTPTAHKSQRKILPSTLVFVEDENKQDKAGSRDTVEDISDVAVEELVNHVLDVAVKQLVLQKSKNVEQSALDSVDITTGQSRENIANVSEADNENSAVHSADEWINSASCEHQSNSDIDTVHSGEPVSSVTVSDEKSPVRLTNKSYIDDDLLGNDSLCDNSYNSYTDSSKSEEELLASITNTPAVHVSKASPSEPSNNPEPVCNTEPNQTVESELPPILKWLALGERVRSATSSVAGCVVSSETQTRHLQWLPGKGRAVLTHDIACSPLPCTVVDSGTVIPDRIQTESETQHSVASLQAPNMDSTKTDDADGEALVSDNAVSDVSSSPSLSQQIVSADETMQKFKSTMCSPIAPSLNSMACLPVSISSESKMCSPITPSLNSMACLPVSISSESKMCSPIQIKSRDVSVQNITEVQSAMCSPMFIPTDNTSAQTDSPPECRSVPCSPMLVPVQDVSIQNEAEMQSVMCSPMVPCPNQDKSVLVQGPELVDMGVGPDFVPQFHVGISVKPDTLTIATEMDCPLMNTIATSMTPVKIGNKLGRKLTAEDIRKQHPRVVANELDTLRTENVRLSGQVQGLLKDTKKLVDQQELMGRLEKLHHDYNELQERYDTDVMDLKTQLEDSHKHQQLLQEAHDKQMADLREDFESRDYYQHFLSSQKLVTQLQTDLHHYTKLLNDMDHSCQIQGELSTVISSSFNKISRTKDKITTASEHLKNKFKELLLDQETLKMEQLLLEDEQVRVEKERTEMAFIVSRCKDNVLQLDGQVEQLSTQLCQTKLTNTELQSQLSTVTADLETVKEKNIAMTTKVEELTVTEGTLKVKVEELTTSSSCLTEQLEETQTSLSSTEKQHTADKEKFKDENEKKQLVIVNLERTLEMREADIDMLEKDLFEAREIICKQMDALKKADAQEKVANTRIEQLNKHNVSLREKNAALSSTEKELRTSLGNVTEELAGTQQQATRILKLQGTEIADSFTAIGQLTEHMTTFLNSLANRHGLQLDQSQTEAVGSLGSTFSGNSSQISKEIKSSQSHSSLVAQILQAANNHGNNLEDETQQAQDSEESSSAENKSVEEGQRGVGDTERRDPPVVTVSDTPHTVSRRRLGVSHNSAFAPVRSANIEKGEETDVGSADVEKDVTDGEESVDTVRDGNEGGLPGSLLQDLQLPGGRDGDERLSDQVSRLGDVFEKIHHMAQVIEKALWSSLHDLRLENDELNRKVSQSDYVEKHCKAELELKMGELEQSGAKCKVLEKNLQELGDKFEEVLDQEVEAQRQLLEVQQLRGKVVSLEGEKDVLTQQVAGLLSQIEHLSSGTLSDTSLSSQREILALQNKVEKYRDQLLKKDDCIEEISSKAARRIQKLENNWKLADSEVCRLDELVSVIRGALRARAKATPQDGNLMKLLKLIDGVDSAS